MQKNSNEDGDDYAKQIRLVEDSLDDLHLSQLFNKFEKKNKLLALTMHPIVLQEVLV